MQVWNQSSEDGAISMLKAATDPALQGRGFAYFGPPYKGPAVLHKNNDRKCCCGVSCHVHTSEESAPDFDLDGDPIRHDVH